jgi:hypothetical protein
MSTKISKGAWHLHELMTCAPSCPPCEAPAATSPALAGNPWCRSTWRDLALAFMLNRDSMRDPIRVDSP